MAGVNWHFGYARGLTDWRLAWWWTKEKRGLNDHHDSVLALAIVQRLGNGPTEAVNCLNKRVQRVAFGFGSSRNCRIRTLLYAGKPNWSLPPVTPR